MVDGPRQRRPKGAPFEASVIDTGDCHLWTGALSRGYGNYKDPATKRNLPAHVYAWEQANGPVSEGHELHHLCHVRSCVNLAHLQMLTPTEHHRAHGLEVTHCPQGHEYTEENTYYSNEGNGHRRCRTCHRDQMRERRRAHEG
jgi:hypothetical protein